MDREADCLICDGPFLTELRTRLNFAPLVGRFGDMRVVVWTTEKEGSAIREAAESCRMTQFMADLAIFCGVRK